MGRFAVTYLSPIVTFVVTFVYVSPIVAFVIFVVPYVSLCHDICVAYGMPLFVVTYKSPLIFVVTYVSSVLFFRDICVVSVALT